MQRKRRDGYNEKVVDVEDRLEIQPKNSMYF